MENQGVYSCRSALFSCTLFGMKCAVYHGNVKKWFN